MNNDGAGATQRRGGQWDCAINRAAGYTKTMKACENRTRSRHTGTSQNNLWKSAGSGLGGNVKGYGSHGKSGY
jgi:hypothetical protein